MVKLPQKPPSLANEKLPRVLQQLGNPSIQQYITEANTAYFHWDKLRHRPPLAGLDPEEAWLAVKLSRMGQRRFLPLVDEHRLAFNYWMPLPSLRVLHEVDRMGGTMIGLEAGAAPAIREIRERVLISSLMEEAIATSQIEGAATTRRVAKEMLRTNRKPRDRSEQMIVNSYRTIQTLRQRLDVPLSLDLLFEIQESMTRDTLDDPTGVGRLRTPDEAISVIDVRDNEVVFTPPPADRLPDRLARLIDFANAEDGKDNFIHPLVKAAVLHFWLAYEHPFIDGNGRTARSLFYWYMLKRGYWLFEFLTISRVIMKAPMQYYRSFLHSEHDDNDLTYSVLFQLEATQQALVSLRQYLAEKQAEQQRAAAALRRFPDLNHRQRAVLDRALQDPSQVFTFQSHQHSQGITLVTARNDLLDLAGRKLLVETKQGRQRAFVAAPDLADQLDFGEKKPKRPRER